MGWQRLEMKVMFTSRGLPELTPEEFAEAVAEAEARFWDEEVPYDGERESRIMNRLRDYLAKHRHSEPW